MYESALILDHLEEAFQERPLMPSDNAPREEAKRLINSVL